MASKYYLADHIHVCRTGRYCIFLDLNADRYFSIPVNAFLPLAPSIHGWNVTDCPLPHVPDASGHSELLATLLRRHVLLQDPRGGKAAAPPPTSIPTADALSMLDEQQHAIDTCARTFGRALCSLGYAQMQLRCRPLRRIVADIVQTKSAHASVPRFTDLPATLALTAIFARVRPYFPRSFLCLFDSLALIHFLARFGVYPDWVFGVREDPFLAHCWVQSGDVILNDYHDRVAPYTPILVV